MVGLDSTKTAFFQAFRELAWSVPVSEISVADIIRLSKISKATFYRHFSDKFEVMNFLHEEHMKANNPFKYDLRGGTLNLLSFFTRNQKYYCAIVKYQGQNSFVESFHRCCGRCMMDFLKSNRTEMNDTLKFAADFYSIGYCDTIIRWLSDGCACPEECLANDLASALPLPLTAYFAPND